MGNSLAVRMRIWRATYRVSQERAAFLADVALKTWQRWERGESDPAPMHIDDLLMTIGSPPPGWQR